MCIRVDGPILVASFFGVVLLFGVRFACRTGIRCSYVLELELIVEDDDADRSVSRSFS